MIRKYKGFVTCVNCYHVITIFCYKVSIQEKKQKAKLMIAQTFHWLS